MFFTGIHFNDSAVFRSSSIMLFAAGFLGLFSLRALLFHSVWNKSLKFFDAS